FQALGAHFIESVLCSVPPTIIRAAVSATRLIARAVVEIDKIDGGNSGLQKRDVIVFYVLSLVWKLFAVAEPLGGAPNDIVKPIDRASLALDVETFIADHVEEDHRLHVPDLAFVAKFLDHSSRPVSVIVVFPRAGHRLFAVEECKPKRVLRLRLGELSSKFKKNAGARSAVVGSDKLIIGKPFRIVMARYDDHAVALSGHFRY